MMANVEAATICSKDSCITHTLVRTSTVGYMYGVINSTSSSQSQNVEAATIWSRDSCITHILVRTPAGLHAWLHTHACEDINQITCMASQITPALLNPKPSLVYWKCPSHSENLNSETPGVGNFSIRSEVSVSRRAETPPPCLGTAKPCLGTAKPCFCTVEEF